MPRGGRRLGAGRKPALGTIERLAIGAQCERLWQEEWSASLDRTKNDALRGLSREWKEADSVPVPERASWLGTLAGEEYLENVEFARRELLQIPDENEEPAPRLIHFNGPRPKSHRKGIMSAVAREQSLLRAVPISVRLVEACWKEFRALQRRLAEND